MKTLEELQSKVERMLDGERKRRNIANDFLVAVEKILIPIAPHIWTGKIENESESTNAIPIKDVNQKYTGLYFRWERIETQHEIEHPGFLFCADDYSYTLWGLPIEDTTGSHYWYAIRVILEWIPRVANLIDSKEESRNKLLGLLK